MKWISFPFLLKLAAQGSVLSRFYGLSFIYINDLNCGTTSITTKFVGDTKIWLLIRSDNDATALQLTQRTQESVWVFQ